MIGLPGISLFLISGVYGDMQFYDNRSAWESAWPAGYVEIRLDRMGLEPVLGHTPYHAENFGQSISFPRAITKATASFDLSGISFDLSEPEDLLFWAAPTYTFDIISLGGPVWTNDDWEINISPQDTAYAFAVDMADSNENPESQVETMSLYGENNTLLATIRSDQDMIKWPNGNDQMFLGVISSEPICRITFDEAATGSDNIGLRSIYLPVPEPVSLFLLGLGGWIVFQKRRD